VVLLLLMTVDEETGSNGLLRLRVARFFGFFAIFVPPSCVPLLPIEDWAVAVRLLVSVLGSADGITIVGPLGTTSPIPERLGGVVTVDIVCMDD